MKRIPLVIGLTFFALAIVIFVFSDGLRRFYSGGFFLMLAVFLLFSSYRKPAATGASPPHEEEQSVTRTDD